MHIFTEYVAKYLSLKMLIFGLSWLEYFPSIMSIVFITKKNATALQQHCCFFPLNISMLDPYFSKTKKSDTKKTTELIRCDTKKTTELIRCDLF